MALNFQQNGSATLRRVVPVVLLVVSLALVTLYAREGEEGPLHTVQKTAVGLVAPITSVGAAADAGIQSVSTNLDDLTASDATLSEMRENNQKLRELLARADEYKQEADRLRGLLDMKDSYGIDGAAARVIGRSLTAWDQTVTIDVGSDDGVSSGMTVMGSTGVIGQVTETTTRTAKVRLLTDPQSGAAALIESNRAEGIVRGSYEGLLYLEHIDEEHTPVPGDVVVTSGLGGSYTRGLIIGTVARVDQSKGNATGKIVVSPNDSVSSLAEVLVVRGLNSENSNSAQPAQDVNTTSEGGGDGL